MRYTLFSGVRGPSRLGLLNLLELLGLGFRGVIAVEGVAATDQAVARAGGAVAEGAADGFGGEGPLPYRIGQYPRVPCGYPEATPRLPRGYPEGTTLRRFLVRISDFELPSGFGFRYSDFRAAARI